MRLVVTAGNTQAPIDRVRCITNIFTGRTGAGIALAAHARGHMVTLLTSHPETVRELSNRELDAHWAIRPYQTFEQLRDLIAETIRGDKPHAVIHSAAVSDYLVAGVFAPRDGTHFRNGHWQADMGLPTLVDRAAGKVRSDEPELWLRLARAPKLIDCVRAEWGFDGVLVKFKLEVGVADDRLLAIAERSRRQSGADLMVANTLEGAAHYAFLGPLDGRYHRVARADLANHLIDAVEKKAEEGPHG